MAQILVLWKKNEFYVTYVSGLEEIEKSPIEGITNSVEIGGRKYLQVISRFLYTTSPT